MADAPKRAFCLTLKLEADTRSELVGALLNFATQVDRSEVTKGIWGGPMSGGIYELHASEHPSHEEYFEQVRQYLDERDNVPLPPAEIARAADAGGKEG